MKRLDGTPEGESAVLPVRVPMELKQKLQKKAKRKRISVSELVRNVLARFAEEVV